MNKSDLIKLFAEKLETTNKEAKEIYESLVAIITEEVTSAPADAKITIPGIVTYIKTPRDATVKRNPHNGEDVQVDAHTHLRATPPNPLKQAVR